MVMIGSFGAHIVHGFFLYAIGILNVAFLENFQEDVGKTSWACGIFLGLFSLAGKLSDWYAFQCKAQPGMSDSTVMFVQTSRLKFL